MTLVAELTAAAEAEWLDGWTAGPAEDQGSGLPAGARAPDLALADHTGKERLLSEFWAGQPALLMFWRHFGCGCGVARAGRLKAEYQDYLDAGLNPVIVAQGEPGPGRRIPRRARSGVSGSVRSRSCGLPGIWDRAVGGRAHSVRGAAGVLEPPARGRGELPGRPARPGPPAGG